MMMSFGERAQPALAVAIHALRNPHMHQQQPNAIDVPVKDMLGIVIHIKQIYVSNTK